MDEFGYDQDLGTIACMRIESDLFVIVMEITAHSILSKSDDYERTCDFDVTTMYYCKDNHRLGYDLEEKPPITPDGTLIELNFEMQETNTDLAAYSKGIVESDDSDDRSFWPNFQTPDKVAATDMAIDVLSKTIGAVVGLLSLNAIAGFAVGVATDYFITELRAGNDCPFDTDYSGAVPVEIDYRNLVPNGQTVKYPDSNHNYAYDAISRHEIKYKFKTYDALTGQTIGLKFRCHAEYVDGRDDTLNRISSDWVKVEFKLLQP